MVAANLQLSFKSASFISHFGCYGDTLFRLVINPCMQLIASPISTSYHK